MRNQLSFLALAASLFVPFAAPASASQVTTQATTAVPMGTSAAAGGAVGRTEPVRGHGSRAASKTTSAARTSGAAAAGGDAAASTAALVAGGIVPLPAHRIADTRFGQGVPKAAVKSGTALVLDVTGREGIPEGTRTVALTITATQPSAAGHVTAFAHGTTQPSASSLNFAPGQSVPNLVVTQASSTGLVDLYVGGSGTVQLIVDVAGYVANGTPADPGTLTSVAPTRLLDTRSGIGTRAGLVAGGARRIVTVAGRASVPTMGAASAVLNVTVTGGTAAGYVTAAPVLTGPATTSSVNYIKGQTRANLVVVPLSATGTFDLKVTSSGSVHMIADIVGWVRTGAPAADGGVAAVAPSRILDTRGDPAGPLADQDWVTLGVTGYDGVPATGVSAVLVNVTTTAATAQGWVAALPTAPNLPTGTNLNFAPVRNDANLVLVPVSPDGYIDLVVGGTTGTVHLVADIAGYVLGSPVDTTPPSLVTNVSLTQPSKNSITLTWVNPLDADFAGVTIRRVADGEPPTDPLAGTVVAETTGTTFTDSGLTPGTTFSYAIWAHDSFPNVAYPGTAQATTTPLSFGAAASVAPFRGAPSGVSCPTSTWCMSVDRSGRALSWNGSTWSAPVTIATVSPQDDVSMSVSCPTTAFCMAAVGPEGFATWENGAWSAPVKVASPQEGAGWYTVTCVSSTWCVGLSDGYMTRFDGTSWTTPQKAIPPMMGSVSCVSTSFCMAVGQDMTGAGFVSRWNGSTWSAASKIAAAGTSIYNISCVSTSFCMATLSTFALRWNGTTWTSFPLGGSNGFFQGRSVSCTSSTFCMSFDPQIGVSRWNGSGWSAVSSLSPTKTGNGMVECASASLCLVVDDTGRFAKWNGTSWSSMTMFDRTSGIITSLSCPTVTSCLAGDAYGTVHRWSGGAWEHTALGTSSQLVGCASDVWCVAAEPFNLRSRLYTGSWAGPVAMPGTYGQPSCPVAGWCMTIDDQGGARTWTGTQWSAATPVLGVPGSSNANFVKCTSKTSCVAVSGNAWWSRWNGATWTGPQRISTGLDNVELLECASPTMCLVAGYDGITYRYTGASWVRQSGAFEIGRVDAISCPATNFCAAVGGGSMATFNGQTWNTARQELNLPSNRSYNIDCPSVYTCVIASPDKVIRSS